MREPDRRLFAHHVGGRGGTVALPPNRRFAGKISHIIYDADPDCVAEIAQHWDSGTTVLPFCLGDHEQDTVFHLNQNPFTSSVFPFNRAYAGYYEEMRVGYSDCVFGQAFEPQRTLTLPTTTLDGLHASGRIPRADFLSLDTQGSELAILRGGADMLSTTTVAVVCEVSFADLYVGAPLFGEVDAFMRGRGFMLADLSPMRFGVQRIPRAFRGNGVPVQGEALYLLKPQQVRERGAATCHRLEMLAFCSLAFGFVDVAYLAMQQAAGCESSSSDDIALFLRQFKAKVDAGGKLPPLWHEYIAANPTASGEGSKALIPRLVRRLRQNPRLFLADLRRFGGNWFVRGLSALHAEKFGFNDFETFLRDNGFDRAAHAVFLRRQA